MRFLAALLAASGHAFTISSALSQTAFTDLAMFGLHRHPALKPNSFHHFDRRALTVVKCDVLSLLEGVPSVASN